MKSLFDEVSIKCSQDVTKHYSTSFSMAVKLLGPKIRNAIYSIYGFVRFADEIVDSFHDYDKELLLQEFEQEYDKTLDRGISLNPILNAFQHTVRAYCIPNQLVRDFLHSMKLDLYKSEYSMEEYQEYIYGSADVVGLMCLHVFVKGDLELYQELKEPAMKLGSAFQKVNFLRDLKNDVENLDRKYFPHINFNQFDVETKKTIINEIEEDFRQAYKGILNLPKDSRFGVYTAFIYYRRLLMKLKATPSERIMESRIRVSNATKFSLLASSFVRSKLNLW